MTQGHTAVSNRAPGMEGKSPGPAVGFDNPRYLQDQTAAILERVAHSGNKLYLEFGGKLLFDYHAA